MIQRTKSEMKAYVDGYNACFNQFIENLKGINENPLYKIISNMHVMRAAVNAVVESEEDMPNSLKCKVKHLCHNRTITERERDRILKALEQEPCEDAVSRQAVLDLIADYDLSMGQVVKGIHALPPVNPQKIGHWIADVDKWGDIVTTVNGYRCNKCNTFNADKDNYCPYCGAKMFEPKESEE